MKQGGFAVILEKAANRITGDAASLQDELILGKFISISTVLWTYLGGNYITLIKNFGILLALLAVYAVVTLLDGKFNWFLGPDRRRLQILAVRLPRVDRRPVVMDRARKRRMPRPIR